MSYLIGGQVGGTLTLSSGDLEIGAVEIKNADTDDRAHVDPAGSLSIATGRLSLQSHFEAVTGWIAQGAATANLATSVVHRGEGTLSLEFDKVTDGALTEAWISKVLTTFDASAFADHSVGTLHIYLSALTDVAKVWVRMGTSTSHYWQWDFDDDLLSAGWNHLTAEIGHPTSQTGNGADLSAITFIAFGVTFDASTDTLADIRTGGWAMDRIIDTFQVGQPAVSVEVPFIALRDQNSNTRADVVSGSAGMNHLQVGLTDGTTVIGVGSKADAASLPVSQSTEDKAVLLNLDNKTPLLDFSAAPVQRALAVTTGRSTQLAIGWYVMKSNAPCFVRQGSVTVDATDLTDKKLESGVSYLLYVSNTTTHGYIAGIVTAGTGTLEIQAVL